MDSSKCRIIHLRYVKLGDTYRDQHIVELDKNDSLSGEAVCGFVFSPYTYPTGDVINKPSVEYTLCDKCRDITSNPITRFVKGMNP
jgi:hypothetical protein